MVKFVYQGAYGFLTTPLVGIKAQGVDRRLVSFFRTATAFGLNDAALLEAAQGLQQGWLGDPSPTVKHFPTPRLHAMQHLREADAVAVTLEAKGAADDVEQHLEFRTRKLRQELIEELIRHLRVSGTAKAPER